MFHSNLNDFNIEQTRIKTLIHIEETKMLYFNQIHEICHLNHSTSKDK